MLPAETLWAVPPEVAEKARMTDSGIPGCPYRFLESDELPFIDGTPVYGLQLHHPRFLELVGAPESARLLDRTPLYWVEEMGKERAMVAADTLQRDAGVMLSNLQILSQFAMVLNRMSFSMMALGLDRSEFPGAEVDALSPAPRARRAAPYISAMGLWRPQENPTAPRPAPTRGVTCVETASIASRTIRFLRSEDIRKGLCSDIFRIYIELVHGPRGVTLHPPRSSMSGIILFSGPH